LNLQLTKKLADKLKVDMSPINISKSDDIDNYHCNLLKFGREYGILITNDKTLYSFYLHGFKAKEFKDFEYIFKESIFKLLLDSGLEQYQFEKILNSMETIKYTKTSNRSVTASMTDMSRFIESSLYNGDDIFTINRKINTIPYKKNDYKYAMKLFDELLK